MPAVGALAELQAAVDAAMDAVPAPLALAVDDDARAAVDASFARAGMLLLGEIHGVDQVPHVLGALIELFAVDTLALEWPDELSGSIDAFCRDGVVRDHPLLWLGDGRVTAGHLALVRHLAASGRDVRRLHIDPWAMPPPVPGESPWTARDQAMAHRVLGHAVGRVLVVAGDAHTPTARTRLGVPMGAWLARERPALRAVLVRHGAGSYYNFGSRTLVSRHRPRSVRLRLVRDELVLDLPAPAEATVPHRPTLRRGREGTRRSRP